MINAGNVMAIIRVKPIFEIAKLNKHTMVKTFLYECFGKTSCTKFENDDARPMDVVKHANNTASPRNNIPAGPNCVFTTLVNSSLPFSNEWPDDV